MKTHEPNRYENAIRTNHDLAVEINKDITALVKKAEPILNLVEKDRDKYCQHDPRAGRVWMGHYLSDVMNKILDSYGLVSGEALQQISSIPAEVKEFTEKGQKYRLVTNFDSYL